MLKPQMKQLILVPTCYKSSLHVKIWKNELMMVAVSKLEIGKTQEKKDWRLKNNSLHYFTKYQSPNVK